MSFNKIPYGHHDMDQDDIDAVVSALKRWSITQGQIAEDFGQALADYTGAKYGIAVSSGTAALHVAVAALDIKAGDEVITCPMTFCATANSVLYQGGTPVFVDIDETTLNIDPTKIEEKITSKTKAIMPIDFRGHPAPLYEIKKIADKYGLKVIEDGAHSIGSKYTVDGNDYMCGDGIHADICTFSFHPVKHITTGEGGAVLTNDPKLYKKMGFLRKHGLDRQEEMFCKEKRISSWIYEMESLGFNYRMNEFQAALGLSQLSRIEKNKQRRREIVAHYNEQFKEFGELILPYESKSVNSNFHIYVLQVKENKYFDRYDLFTHLLTKDFLPMVHYIPTHLLQYYKNRYGYKRGDFPNAESYYDRTISIPMYPSLRDSEIEKTVNDISDFIINKTSGI
jgi:perosamine synthetase